jgi:hypothetical protein
MSGPEEITGVVNVEDDGPAVVADPATPVVAAVVPDPAVPAAEPPEEDDPTTVDLKDIPKVGGLLGELKQQRQLNKQLKEKAARADQLEAYVNDSRPYVEFLKNNPDLLKPRQAAPAPQPAAPQDDPRAAALAQTLDLYTPDGKPDVARATTIQRMMAETAQQMVQQAVAPVHERTHQEASAYNFRVALTLKDNDGVSPSQESLTQIWKTMPASQTSDPNVASILALTAIGLDRVSKKKQPAAPGRAPVVTEGTGNVPGRASLSVLEQSVARDRGVKESEWAERTKGFQSGRSHTLED